MDFTFDGVEYKQGEVFPQDDVKPGVVRQLWGRSRIDLYFGEWRDEPPAADETPDGADVADERPNGPEISVMSGMVGLAADKAGSDTGEFDIADYPGMTHSGGPWYRIEGVKGAFKGHAAAVEAWQKALG